MTIGTIGTGTGAPIHGILQPAPPPTEQIVSAPLAPIPGTTPPPTATGASLHPGIATPSIPPRDGTGAAMPTIVPPPISTVQAETKGTQAQAAETHGSRTPGAWPRKTETHVIKNQWTEIHWTGIHWTGIRGTEIHGIKIHGIKICGIKIRGTWTPGNPWQSAVIGPSVTGIGIPRNLARKFDAVHRAPGIPGTMAPECLEVTSLC